MVDRALCGAAVHTSFSDPAALCEGHGASGGLSADPGLVRPRGDPGCLGSGASRQRRGHHPHQEYVQGIRLADGQRHDLGGLLGRLSPLPPRSVYHQCEQGEAGDPHRAELPVFEHCFHPGRGVPPRDLPDGWEHSPEEDGRSWLTKQTEAAYYNFRANKAFRREYFLKQMDRWGILPFRKSREHLLGEILRKNPRMIGEPVYQNELDARAKQILKNYAVGRLIVAGDNRYLSGDLLDFISFLLLESVPKKRNGTRHITK